MSSPARMLLVAAALLASVMVGCTVTPDQAMNARWNSYGNDNSSAQDWTGGDGGYSINLPDNRVVWLFSDPFLGTITNGTRQCPPGAGQFVHNAMVIQNADGSLGQTLTRHDAGGKPLDLVPVQNGGGDYYTWSNGIMEGGKLKTLLFRTDGVTGQRDSTDLATFTVSPSIQLESATTLVSGKPRDIDWGSGLLKEPDYTYVYGNDTVGGGPHTDHVFLARAPAGNLGGGWEYRTASGWSSDVNAAVPLVYGNGQQVLYSAPNAINVNGAFVLVGVNGNAYPFNGMEIFWSVAPNPWGPFADQGVAYDPPEGIVYNPTFHPEPANGGEGLLMGYSVHAQALSADKCPADVNDYRPRYLRANP